MFDTLANGMEALIGSDPPQALADTMHAAWVSFATTGDSGWPQYDLDRRATMRFNITSAIMDDPRSAQRELWDGVSLAVLSWPIPSSSLNLDSIQPPDGGRDPGWDAGLVAARRLAALQNPA